MNILTKKLNKDIILYTRYVDEITFTDKRESGIEANAVTDAEEETNVASIEKYTYIEEDNNVEEVHVIA